MNYVIWGCPGVGKSSYVKERAGENVVIFDYDKVMQTLSGKKPHDRNQNLHYYVMAVREMILYKLASEEKIDDAYIIASRKNSNLLAAVGDLLVEYVFVEKSKDEIIQQVMDDPEREDKERWKKLIDEWFDWYENEYLAEDKGFWENVVVKGGEKVPEYIDLEKFKHDKRLQKKPHNFRKYYTIEPVKSIEETKDGLEVDFVISTEVIDRSGDTIAVDGWSLDNYRKNPVILWAHDYSQPPVAKSLSEEIKSKKLRSKALFPPRDLSEFGNMVGMLYANGYMNAVSVGFNPTEWSFVKDDDRPYGVDFQQQELLEYSCVPVPCNPEALVDAKGMGIDLNPMLNWAIETLEKSDFQENSTAEHIWRLLETKKSFLMPKIRAIPIEPTAEEKGVTPSNPSGYKLAPEDEEWSALTLQDFTDQSWDELSTTEKNKIAKHFAWAAELPPETFGSLKLGHHRASDGACVWRGVANAVARLDQTDVPEADKESIRSHFAKHYRDFDKTPPWEEEDGKANRQPPDDLYTNLIKNIERRKKYV